jgi:hypothetical protein
MFDDNGFKKAWPPGDELGDVQVAPVTHPIEAKVTKTTQFADAERLTEEWRLQQEWLRSSARARRRRGK